MWGIWGIRYFVWDSGNSEVDLYVCKYIVGLLLGIFMYEAGLVGCPNSVVKTRCAGMCSLRGKWDGGGTVRAGGYTFVWGMGEVRSI